jgi:hypothetical protein
MASTFNCSRYHALMFRTGTRLSPSSDLPLLSDKTFQQVLLFVIDRSRFLRAKLANARSPCITSSTWSPPRATRFLCSLGICIFSQRNHSSTDQYDRSAQCHLTSLRFFKMGTPLLLLAWTRMCYLFRVAHQA